MARSPVRECVGQCERERVGESETCLSPDWVRSRSYEKECERVSESVREGVSERGNECERVWE
jgi:hypothetical protein